jgi:hypothetical protein
VKKVIQITFTILVDGKKHEAMFLRREKVKDLMNDPGSLGEFLRDLADLDGKRS